jgi:glucosamine kinase
VKPREPSPLGLGIDAGGTRTRWALARVAAGADAAQGDVAGCARPAIAAEGSVRGMSALQLREPGRLQEALAELAAQVLAHGRPARVHAGLTGLGNDVDALRAVVAAPFGLAPEAVAITSDIEIAYLDIFSPGAGYVVYAGTGSVAAFIDEGGVLHRAGGRGVVLDDGGGGFWIAREALRHVWRLEDESPGSWRQSPLAIALFEHVGGSDWAYSRDYIYNRDRGAMGELALAVAKSADADPVAREILAAAGRELARLALAMVRRHGPRPVALTGRAVQLHPLIEQSMRAALPAGVALEARTSLGHHAAARLAARAAAREREA